MKKLIFSIGGYFSGMVCIVSRYIKSPVPNCIKYMDGTRDEQRN